MKLKIKKLYNDAQLPTMAYDDAAGLDLYVHHMEVDSYGNVVLFSGIAVEPEEGYFCDLRPCSRNKKYDLILTNGIGTIDGDYRGDIMAAFKPLPSFTADGLVIYPSLANTYTVGDVFAQIVFHKKVAVEIEEAESLTPTARGDKGYGSSNKKQIKQ